jgi:hypothetical protein
VKPVDDLALIPRILCADAENMCAMLNKFGVVIAI